jgi:acetyl-CoA synthetase
MPKHQIKWKPSQAVIQKSNSYAFMQELGIENYQDFWQWSVTNKALFWEKTVQKLGIPFQQKPTVFLDLSQGKTQAKWLSGAKFNIVDACFQNTADAVVLKYQKEGGNLVLVTQKELEQKVNQIANSLYNEGLEAGDTIAIDTAMTYEAVAIYLGAIKAGIPVVSIADSFAPDEIAVRLNIGKPKLVFTQDVLLRAGKKLPLYQKVCAANAPKTVVIKVTNNALDLRNNDVLWEDFLVNNTQFKSISQNPDDVATILFSSGTTGAPKAIPWTHTTPIKSASDGYYHQDIHQNDTVCWPTNLGWMMGPWLVYAALINKASIALYYGAPMTAEFGAFVQNTQVTMLGVIPSIVKYWKNSQVMEPYNWSAIKCFSSTGEVSNPEEMNYLMDLAGNKPVIEYCGGTEIGGGYVTSTLVQDNIASIFSSQALGGEFVLLDENNQPSNKGEVFLIPPILGISNRLLNKDHHEVYYKDTPTHKGQPLRRHGDQMQVLENGYYAALGRVDDSMNLGGIKVSAVQLEEVVSSLEYVQELAAIAISPVGGGPSELVLYIVSNTKKPLDEIKKEAQQLIRSKVNPLFKVSDVLHIDKLPRTASNKVMRRKLRDAYENKLLK